jgi:cytochrome c-type biogenesis protein
VGIHRKVFLSTLLFVLGFSLIFILLGASATLVGRLVSDYTAIVMLMGGVLMGILGIHLTGLFRIHLLDFDRHINIKKRPMHMLSALLIGMAFGAGWSPCVGPLLGSILMIAGSKETIGEGILLLSVYSIGLGLPFIILSFFINRLLDWVKKASRMMSCLNKGAGILLILMGFYLVFTALINLFHFSW